MALALRLAGILYAMWRDGAPYDVRRIRGPRIAAYERQGDGRSFARDLAPPNDHDRAKQLTFSLRIPGWSSGTHPQAEGASPGPCLLVRLRSHTAADAVHGGRAQSPLQIADELHVSSIGPRHLLGDRQIVRDALAKQRVIVAMVRGRAPHTIARS